MFHNNVRRHIQHATVKVINQTQQLLVHIFHLVTLLNIKREPKKAVKFLITLKGLNVTYFSVGITSDEIRSETAFN
jgi:hypothetical protein